jgi:hypothetical protein
MVTTGAAGDYRQSVGRRAATGFCTPAGAARPGRGHPHVTSLLSSPGASWGYSVQWYGREFWPAANKIERVGSARANCEVFEEQLRFETHIYSVMTVER